MSHCATAEQIFQAVPIHGSAGQVVASNRPMRITAVQRTVFEREALRDYPPRMVSHLRRQLPKKAARYTDEELEALVLSGVERAPAYGLVLGSEVAQLLYLMLVLGRDFDSEPRYAVIRRALMRSDIDAETKLNHIFTLLLP
jgi:hypothetical protein